MGRPQLRVKRHNGLEKGLYFSPPFFYAVDYRGICLPHLASLTFPQQNRPFRSEEAHAMGDSVAARHVLPLSELRYHFGFSFVRCYAMDLNTSDHFIQSYQ
ncbi:hypothetical protein CDAR_441291 [Caerostris darwini]|uniref:Uncharacterized protein n=1 Tax=Caerostris darwini TaxID=1538125 RepID=A0AAV4TPV0_9ARAC|nr:hypothetical protein CDAR_441291 [Caerostris darwini]